MHTSTVTSKGTVTIPAQIRKQAGIKPADKVNFTYNDNKLTLEKTPDITQAFGALHNPKVKPLSVKDMNRLITEGLFGRK